MSLSNHHPAGTDPRRGIGRNLLVLVLVIVAVVLLVGYVASRVTDQRALMPTPAESLGTGQGPGVPPVHTPVGGGGERIPTPGTPAEPRYSAAPTGPAPSGSALYGGASGVGGPTAGKYSAEAKRIPAGRRPDALLGPRDSATGDSPRNTGR